VSDAADRDTIAARLVDEAATVWTGKTLRAFKAVVDKVQDPAQRELLPTARRPRLTLRDLPRITICRPR
jgi:hypothetical protein